MTIDRKANIADTITDLWPHRMSGTAAEAINRTFLRHMADEVEEVNRANGWYDDDRTFGDDIALLHSEVSEAMEAFRDHGYNDVTAIRCRDHVAHNGSTHVCKPEGVGSELADVLIRLLDTASRRGVDLMAEYERKIRFNRTRGYRHGGKAI